MSLLRSLITGVGGYLPPNIMTNAEIATLVDTNDEWIVERTGIRSRRRAPADISTSDLATEAAKRALAAAGRSASEVDLIVVATTTPDLTFPATATIVQLKIGAPVGIAFDIQAVCSGFVYARRRRPATLRPAAASASDVARTRDAQRRSLVRDRPRSHRGARQRAAAGWRRRCVR